ncbi:MAG: DMT family transporter [Phycisphaeraceae bacterium]|nr:DMT family transporter [Phycisphaeraceae bacterium]MCB9848320.1 DMT family transporter [Phycisphaeraceae bacterium]
MSRAVLFAIAAGVCWGVGEVFTKSVLHSKQIGPVTAIAVRSTIALPVLWAAYYFAVIRAQMEPTSWLQADRGVLLKLTLGSGLMAGAAGMLCFYLALHFGEVSRVKPIAFALAPTIAVVLGIIFLHEPLTLRKGLGVASILLGVLLLTGR